jgi:hypothetical protein
VPRVHAEEGELADEGVGHDLEDEGRERRVVLRLADQLRADVVVPDHRRNVQGRREVGDDGVQQLLDPFVLEGAAADDGLGVAGDRRAAEGVHDLLLFHLAAVQVLLEERVVGLGDRLDQLLAVGLRLGAELLGDLRHVERRAEVLALELDRLHPDEVDDAAVLPLAPERDLDRRRVGVQLRLHHLDAAGEVRADPVHLVDEGDAGHPVAVGLAPDRLRLRLDTRDRVEDRDGPSRTRSDRSTSAVKSTWPGVSMMLIRMSFQKQVVAADVIVMPRSCSWTIQSIVAVPSWTSPIL